MKRLLFILLSAALFVPGYGRTPKEYFEAKYGYALIEEDAEELVFPDEDVQRHVIDSCVEEVKKYVYNEVLPSLDKNSIEYAEALLQLSYFLSSQEKRTVLRQARAIIKAKEGQSERYLRALQNEAESWEFRYLTEDIRPELFDTVNSVCLLYQEMFDVCRNLYRPTDSVYLQLIRDLGSLRYYRGHGPIEESEYEGTGLSLISCSSVGVLWRDLTRWNSISEEEYTRLLDGKLFPFYVSWFDDEGGASGDILSNMAYYAPLSPADYIDVGRAHAEISKRIYGGNSQNYLEAASYFLNSLIYIPDTVATAPHIIEAQTLCKDVLQQKQICSEGSKKYYEWLCKDYQCRLSIEGATKTLQQEMGQTAIAIRNTGDTLLTMQITELQTSHALLAGDYARAIKLIQDALKELPELPAMTEENMEDFYKVFERVIPYYISLIQAHVFNREWELAYRYCQVLEEGLMQIQIAPFENTDKREIAQVLDTDGSIIVGHANGFYPYQMQLQKLFAQRLFEWSGYVREQ